MSLLEKSMENCVFLNKSRQPDGEGGFITTWTDGARFKAAITHNSTMEAKIAEKQGVTSLYKVTTAKGIGLEYHEIFRRIRDGKIFRVTSDYDDMITPSSASFQYEQVSAEEWQLV